jgi:hypothetical protein
MKWIPHLPTPMYLSVPKLPAVIFVRSSTLYCGLRFWASLASESQANRRHDCTVDQYPRSESSDGFICRSFDASQAPALAPLTPLGRCSSMGPGFLSREGNQYSFQGRGVYWQIYAVFRVVSQEVGHGRGCSCHSSLICGPRHGELRRMYE